MKQSSFFILSLLLGLAGCGQSTGKWHEHRIIDIHGHIGSFKGYDLSTETLLKNVGEYGLSLVLVSNIDGAELPETENVDERTANERTVEFLRRHAENFRGLLWSRPNDGAPATLERFLSDSTTRRLFVGIKIHPAMNHFPADDPKVDGYLALCEKYGIPAVFHSDASGSNADPRRIYTAARRHPAVPVVLYHSGFKTKHDSALAVVKESIARADAELFLETAQVSADDVMRAITEVGVDHVLFGTDATYYGSEHYKRYEPLIERLKKELPAGDFAKVVRENAVRLFHLER
ncbi:MAG: amidohydrolase family protein [Bacteroidota bacterium]